MDNDGKQSQKEEGSQLQSPQSSTSERPTDRRSIIKREHSSSEKKRAHFNEENIVETYRPANKDYGFDKILEPNTPFERGEAPVDPEELNKRLLDISQGDEDADDDLDQPSTSQQSSEPTEPPPSVASFEAENGATNGEDGRSLSFLEKRKKHVQSEFITAKQLSDSVDDDKEGEGAQ